MPFQGESDIGGDFHRALPCAIASCPVGASRPWLNKVVLVIVEAVHNTM
ncbi:MAG: hypothetical protein LBQ66_02935 [Planctomycetaceae bacterium]|nr:hypothetical protein [Planctomycetaceae bacterium]